jgi:hypothetical protein
VVFVVEYHLYRIKFIKPAQIRLFAEELSPADMFAKALAEKPAITIKRDNVWHVGNIEHFGEWTGAFAIGRTTKTTVERYDDESGNFIEEKDDSGPYTYVLFDRAIGLLGIAKKTKVAPDVQAIARKIRGLFESTRIVQDSGIDVRVDIIPDPDDFIAHIRSAYAIKRFRASFTGPNPVDADELFQKPLSVYCQKLKGDHGTVDVTGSSLDAESIEAVAKSTAATGNSASAKIQSGRGKKTVTVKLAGDAVRVPVDPDTSREVVLADLQQAYHRVRE